MLEEDEDQVEDEKGREHVGPVEDDERVDVGKAPRLDVREASLPVEDPVLDVGAHAHGEEHVLDDDEIEDAQEDPDMLEKESELAGDQHEDGENHVVCRRS